MGAPGKMPYMRPLCRLSAELPAPAVLKEPIFVGPMSPELEFRLTQTCIRHVDSLVVEQELHKLCAEFCVWMAEPYLQLAGYRAITGVVRASLKQFIEPAQVTQAVLDLLPFSLSEVMIGQAVEFANWPLVAHAPALTFMPMMIAARQREFTSLRPGGRPVRASMPDAIEVRQSKPFAYALGCLVRNLQSLRMPVEPVRSSGIDIGNAALRQFIDDYEQALQGSVKFDNARRDIEDGLHYVDLLHHELQYDIGIEAATASVPPETPLRMDLNQHPVMRSGTGCLLALQDEQLRAELLDLLVKALATLSRRQLQAWYFSFVVGLSDDEAARRLGVVKTTYAKHATRALTKLEKLEYTVAVRRLSRCSENPLRFQDLISMHLSAEAFKALTALLPDGLAWLDEPMTSPTRDAGLPDPGSG
jgi:DNA-directed RNA polymerase specialized sigma24 family protein